MTRRIFSLLPLWCVLLALIPAVWASDSARATADAAQLAADSNVYAILYDDGTLVFQYGDMPESGRSVTATYPVDLVNGYLIEYDDEGNVINTTPWYYSRASIKLIDFADTIYPQSTTCWFYDCASLKEITNISNLDTSNATDMSGMFAGCSSLTALDVSGFDTSNATDIGGIFSGCSGLTALDVSGFDTSNVTYMRSMFYGCSDLTALDIRTCRKIID